MMKNNSNKPVTLMILAVVTCVVIGLVSSTAMKLASATFFMKNSKQPTKNPIVELIEDTIDTFVPDTPSDTTPPTSDSGSGSSGSSTPSTPSTPTSSEVATDAPTETQTETQAPETEKETEAPKKEEETKAPETVAPETESTTTAEDVAKNNQAIVKTYNDVLNRAKLIGKEPSFTKTTYRSLERAFWGSWRYKNVEADNADYFIGAEIAKANPLVVPQATNTSELAINNKFSACLLDMNSLDAISKAVKSASKEKLSNGNVKIVIVLNDEENPTPIKDSDKVAESYTSAMFPVVTAAQVTEAIDDKLVESVSLTYKDCTAELIYNPTNGQIVSMKQTVKYEAAVEQGFITAKGTVTEVSDYYNFVY